MLLWAVGRPSGQRLTQGPERSLLGHQGKEARLQGIGDDDVKQLLKVLPASRAGTQRSVRTQSEAWNTWTWIGHNKTMEKNISMEPIHAELMGNVSMMW